MIIKTEDLRAITEQGNKNSCSAVYMDCGEQIVDRDLHKHSFLVKFTKELEHCFDNPDLKIEMIAKNIAVSERQIYRIFKEFLNITPATFLRLYRLEKAFWLIQKGESFGNIAFDVGFSSHSYFSRCFKEKYGETPSAFILAFAENKTAEYY